MSDRVPKIYAPLWMKGAARAEYNRVLPILRSRRGFTEADMATFESYCLAVGVMRDAQSLLHREGLIEEYSAGKRASAPLRVMLEAMTRARMLAAELGLTPLSRSKAKKGEVDQEPQAACGFEDLDL